jgi:hypothetical protein
MMMKRAFAVVPRNEQMSKSDENVALLHAAR